MMSRVVASLLLFLCLSGTMVLSMGVSSGFDDSPAELSFAMAELSSNVQDTATAQDTFNSELDEVNENEVDAASEGITNAEIFAELQSKHRHADAAPGKRTPGVHCDQRADCSSCLTLSSCLWNSNTKKCSAVTDVGRMSRRAQWQYISTCDPNATPTQQHTDRRDRSHVAQAHKHVRLDKRKFTPITALVEMESHQVEKKVPEMSMQLFMDETPSMAVEAAVEGEDVNTVMDRSLLSTEASALTSHEQTMAAAHGVVAAAEHAQLSKLQAMKATIAKKKAAVNDEFHRTTSGAPAGISKTAGVDVWEVQSERNAETSPLGFPIGVVPESSRLVIERYAFVNRKSEGVNVKALYGYGYVAGNAGTYGGWAGYNSCGWFALQNKDEEAPIRGKKVSSRQNHPHKCPTEPALNPSKVLKKGTYLKPSVGAYSKLAATLVTSTCSTFLNYDPSTGLASGPSPTIQAGTYSGSKKTFGTVPVVDGVSATNKVKGFGVRYVTADGKYALINYPFLAPTRGEGNRYYFVDANCVKFDQEGVKAVKASVQ